MALVNVNMQNFEEIVDSNPMLILDFWAGWCGPCKVFSPFFEEMAQANLDVCFGKVDIDKDADLAAAFQVRGVPFLIAFRHGEIIAEQSGLPRPEDFALLLEKLRNPDTL